MSAFASLPGACRAAIRHGNDLSDINIVHWATTFGCGTEDVKDAWEKALTELSREPANSFEEYGE